jgi:hypothetical protein
MQGEYYSGYKVPESKKVTCKICYLSDHTGAWCPSDLDYDTHKGFTIGKGKKLYWLITWHSSGNCTVYDLENRKRWLSGDQEITIHFK